MAYQVSLTLKSVNAKTGPIPVSTTTEETCPDNCPLSVECFAAGGPLAIQWRKVTQGAAGTDWLTFTSRVALLADDTLWRHNQAGDLPGDRVTIDAVALAQLVAANSGKRGFTYTHYDMAISANRDAVRAANLAGFTVNLSANTIAEADDLADTGAGPVVTILPIEYARLAKGDAWLESLEEFKARLAALGVRGTAPRTPAGRVVPICPATYVDTSCKDCGLCAKQRDSIVGFPAHGQSKRKASAIASGERKPQVRRAPRFAMSVNGAALAA